jgi:hypothetical protein
MPIRENGIFRRQMPGYHNAREGCYIYGANTVGIDTGVIIEGEGVLFLGEAAIIEMAEVMGFEVRTDWQAEKRELEERLAYAEHEAEEARLEAAGYKEDLEAFGRALAKQAGLDAKAEK